MTAPASGDGPVHQTGVLCIIKCITFCVWQVLAVSVMLLAATVKDIVGSVAASVAHTKVQTTSAMELSSRSSWQQTFADDQLTNCDMSVRVALIEDGGKALSCSKRIGNCHGVVF